LDPILKLSTISNSTIEAGQPNDAFCWYLRILTSEWQEMLLLG